MDGIDTHTDTNGIDAHTNAAPEQPGIANFIAAGMIRGFLPVTPIYGPVDTYYIGQPIGQFVLAPTSSHLVERLDRPKQAFFAIAAIMAPSEDGTISTSAFVQQAKSGRLRYRYVKLSQRLKQRFEEAESLADMQGATLEHLYLKAEDISRPSGDGRQIEFVELGYGGILPIDARAIVPTLRKQVAAYGWEPCPILTMSIDEVVARVRAADGQLKGFNYEGFDATEVENSIGA